MWYKDNIVFHSHSSIRSHYTYISFPDIISDNLLLSLDFKEVTPTDPPTYNPKEYELLEAPPVYVDNKLHQQWLLRERSVEEKEEHKIAGYALQIADNWKLRFAADELGYNIADPILSTNKSHIKDHKKASYAWKYASVIARNSNAAQLLIEEYGLTDDQADELWTFAMNIED